MEDIVIIGAGVIGCCTAYYLTKHPKYDPAKHRITIVDGCGPAAAASGLSGALLALDMEEGPAADLQRISYKLHEELAEEFDGAKLWKYRQVNTLSAQFDLTSAGANSTKSEANESAPSFIDKTHVSNVTTLGTTGTTCLLCPLDFTKHMLKLAEEAGVKFTKSFAKIEGNTVQFYNATIDSAGSEPIEAKHIIVAAGPWTKLLLPSIEVSANIGHSVTLKESKNALSNDSVMTSIKHEDGTESSPEIFPMKDGFYISAPGKDALLPERADLMQCHPSECQALKSAVDKVSPVLRDVPIETEESAFYPEGGPFIGKVSEGIWVAAGHGYWGISWGPGTGKLMSELLFDGEAHSADISGLSPPS